MKQCRFCNNWIPFYGTDTCLECISKKLNEKTIEFIKLLEETRNDPRRSN